MMDFFYCTSMINIQHFQTSDFGDLFYLRLQLKFIPSRFFPPFLHEDEDVVSLPNAMF